MKYTTRKAVAKDMFQVLELIKELATFEKEKNVVEVTVEDLVKDGFTNKLFHCFVVEYASTVVGMALVYPRYSTWKGPVLHLEDLIVSKNIRNSGLGGALLSEVVKYGHLLGVKRICWEVLDWNESAIAFYKKKGALIKRDWNVVHLDEQGIKNFIANI